MKVVILAGGAPSIFEEDSDKIPKPMAKIGERPILWHIMKLYSYYGYNDFIICSGYRADLIKNYFMNYYIYRSDVTINLVNNEVTIHNNETEPWKVTVVDTGLETSTANRLRFVKEYLEDEFIVVYGDIISDVNVEELVKQHKREQKQITVTLAKPTGRNAIMPIDDEGNVLGNEQQVSCDHGSWANACNMVVSKKALDVIKEDWERFEVETIQKLANINQAATYKHNGFWLPVETKRDKNYLQRLWDENKKPWVVWE